MKPVYLAVEPAKTGERIRELINRNGMTVRMVQEACGFENPQAVYKWLSGKSLPSLDNLVILSYIFHTSIDNILAVSGGDIVFSGTTVQNCLLHSQKSAFMSKNSGYRFFAHFREGSEQLLLKNIKVLQRFSFVVFGMAL